MTQATEKPQFIAYCLEKYKNAENLTDKATIDAVASYRGKPANFAVADCKI